MNSRIRVNIGITRCFVIVIVVVFHAFTFAGSRENCLNTRDPENVNIMKQTCVCAALAFLCHSI